MNLTLSKFCCVNQDWAKLHSPYIPITFLISGIARIFQWGGGGGAKQPSGGKVWEIFENCIIILKIVLKWHFLQTKWLFLVLLD